MTNVPLHELARPWRRLPIVTIKYGLGSGLAAIAFTLLYLSLAYFGASGVWILLLWAGILVVLVYSPLRERLMRRFRTVLRAIWSTFSPVGRGIAALEDDEGSASHSSESSRVQKDSAADRDAVTHIGGGQEKPGSISKNNRVRWTILEPDRTKIDPRG